MAISKPLRLDLSLLDTRTRVPHYNAMQTHRRTCRTQKLAGHLEESPVEKIHLPACLPSRCPGISYMGLQRIPVEQLDKGKHHQRAPLILQTTHPALPLEKSKTDHCLKAKAPPEERLRLEMGQHPQKDWRGAVQLISSQTVAALQQFRMQTTHAEAPPLSKASEAWSQPWSPPGMKAQTITAPRQDLAQARRSL